LRRFVFLSLPLLILAMGLFHFALEATGKAPDPSALAPSGGRVLPQWVALATWTLEALGLSALFLLIHARNGLRWVSGLLTGWIAWVFRGPLLVVTVVELADLPPGPWWSMVFEWWILYSACGLLLGAAAAAAGLGPVTNPAPAPLPFPERVREEEPEQEPAEPPASQPVSPPEAPAGS